MLVNPSRPESAYRIRHFVIGLLALAAALALAVPAGAAVSPEDAEVGVVECTPSRLNDHNPGLAGDADQLICFEGYVSNFDVTQHTDRGKKKFLGVPHWVAHHIKRQSPPPKSGARPSSWFTIPELADKGIAPSHQSYQFSSAFKKNHKNWYDRGHLAQKYLVERLGQKAAFFTHNVVNAVPQRAQFNQKPWLTLECMTGAWANKYGEVWVVAGPVFKKGRPITWLRSNSNKKAVPVAIPVGIFKIVARHDGGQWRTLSFVYPQTHKTYAKAPYDPEIWFKSVAEIEELTGEHFLAGLPNAEALRNAMPDKLWPVSKSDFDDPACKAQKTDVQ